MKFLLFTSSTCSACPSMKANLKKAGIEYEEVDVNDIFYFGKVMSCLVRSVPTLIVIDEKYNPVEKPFVGVYPVSELVKIKERYK